MRKRLQTHPQKHDNLDTNTDDDTDGRYLFTIPEFHFIK